MAFVLGRSNKGQTRTIVYIRVAFFPSPFELETVLNFICSRRRHANGVGIVATGFPRSSKHHTERSYERVKLDGILAYQIMGIREQTNLIPKTKVIRILAQVALWTYGNGGLTRCQIFQDTGILHPHIGVVARAEHAPLRNGSRPLFFSQVQVHARHNEEKTYWISP